MHAKQVMHIFVPQASMAAVGSRVLYQIKQETADNMHNFNLHAQNVHGRTEEIARRLLKEKP